MLYNIAAGNICGYPIGYADVGKSPVPDGIASLIQIQHVAVMLNIQVELLLIPHFVPGVVRRQMPPAGRITNSLTRLYSRQVVDGFFLFAFPAPVPACAVAAAIRKTSAKAMLFIVVILSGSRPLIKIDSRQPPIARGHHRLRG